MQKLIILAVTLSCFSTVRAQNLLANGGFESPGLPSNEPQRFLTNGSSYLSGWTVIDDGIGQGLLYGQSPLSEAIVAGTCGLILNQGTGVKTTFRAEPGNFYELALWLRPGECGQCVSPAPMRVTISGKAYTLPLVSGWSRQTVQFWATNSVNTLEILNPSSPSDYKQFGLDEVSITKLDGAALSINMYPGVLIDGFPGQRYLVQAAADLNSPNWITLTNIFLTNPPVLFLDADVKRPFDYPPKERRIYRAIQVP